MQAHVMTPEAMSADALALSGNSTLDGETLRLWLVRALTVLLILVGVVLTFYIIGTLGFAVYGLPRACFRRRTAVASTSAAA